MKYSRGKWASAPGSCSYCPLLGPGGDLDILKFPMALPRTSYSPNPSTKARLAARKAEKCGSQLEGHVLSQKAG